VRIGARLGPREAYFYGGRRPLPRFISFGIFEVDLQAGELRKAGLKLKLTGQPFQVLAILLERPGEVVAREQLQKRLWPDTFVDVDHNLNTAINKIREALGDSAENPRFVETLPRRGYRFIGPITPPVTTPEPRSAWPATAVPPPVQTHQPLASGGTKSRMAALIFAVTTCVLFGVFAYLRWWQRPEFPSVTAVPFTALPGWAGRPAFSSDGSRIAFAWTGDSASRANGVDLYVKNIGTENLLRLTNHPADWISLAWSPDGTQIAFHRLSKGESAIYVISARGGPEKKLRTTHGSSMSMPISWSPDGKSIAFADSPVSGGHYRLHLLSLETLESTQIEHDEKCQEETLPAFSHDGRQLAYACFPTSSDFALSIANSAGGAPTMIKGFPGWLNGFAWTGDNKRLIFSQFRYGDKEDALREITLANGSVRDLPFGMGAAWPSVAANGERIAYQLGSQAHNNIWRGDLLHPQIPPVKLISSTREQTCPQYSPYAKHIAFSSTRGGSAEIWMSDPDGANVVQLTNLRNLITGTPSWSPDNSKIVFDSRTNGHADLYIVDISERIPHKLVTSTGEASVPSWSHHDKWIYFIGGGGAAGERIYRVPPEGGRATVLSTTRGYGPLESFDGQTVYFAVSTGRNTTLQAASINPTGTEFRVEGMPPLSWVENWTIVRDGVYFYPAEDFKTLSYFDFATKRVRPILKVNGPSFLGLSVSPDGNYILYSQLDEPRSDIMLVNDFH